MTGNKSRKETSASKYSKLAPRRSLFSLSQGARPTLIKQVPRPTGSMLSRKCKWVKKLQIRTNAHCALALYREPLKGFGQVV